MAYNICRKFLHLVFFIFSLLLLWLKITTSTSISNQLVPAAAHYKCIDKERDALLDFKAHIQDPYDMLSTWTTDECCKWVGVTCNNQTGHVTQLDIFGLGGKISPSLLNLSYLSHLDLSFNTFSGTIPMFIGSVTQLTYLDLSDNSFNGTIPMFIGSLTNLTLLSLSDNSLSGTIPTFIGSLTKLTYLGLSGNSFSGTIPTSIGSLTKLTDLYLSDNDQLNGTCIPQELGNLTNMQHLSLRSLSSCTVENIDWLSHMSDLNYLKMDGISLAKANKWVNVILSLQKLSYLSLRGCDLSQVMHPYSSSSVNSSSSSIDTLFSTITS